VTKTDWYKEVRLRAIPRQHISNMETGRRLISLDTAKKPAAIFNASPINFLDI